MKVETLIHDLASDVTHKSNTFHFTFATNSDEPVPNVKPMSYCESIDYVDGKRRLRNSMEAANKLGTTLGKHYT